MEVGPDVKDLKEGDKVILTSSCLGTWRTHAIFQEHDLAKVFSKEYKSSRRMIYIFSIF